MPLQRAPAAPRPDPGAGGPAPLDLRAAFDALVEKLAGWVEGAVLALPNLGVAVLIVVMAAVVARLVRRLVRSGLTRLTQRVGHARNTVALLSTLAYAAVLAAGVFIALGVLRLDGVVTSLLAGAGIIGLALGFAFQDIASNFIAGVFMAVRSPFYVGDIVETNGFLGIVRAINLRTTALEVFDGPRVHLPNAKVFQEPLTNYSWRHLRRVDVPVGVGYGEDLPRVQRVAREAVEAVEGRSPGTGVEVFYTGFGESAIDVEVRFWVPYRTHADYLGARSEAIVRLKAAFDREGIVIPFPIRTLDFGPRGGTPVHEALGGA